MAAFLKFPTDREWETLIKFLDNEGCIIIPPESAIRLSSALGSNITDQRAEFEDKLLDHDFGGEPDVLVDIAYPETLAYGVVEDYMKEKRNVVE